jgi:hypothetical protein
LWGISVSTLDQEGNEMCSERGIRGEKKRVGPPLEETAKIANIAADFLSGDWRLLRARVLPDV